ncbi:unnamed protein product [Caenorhabditis sp. 36 PRJEB53466]|nr:unnamed protein product [Caenorhabditis sp. 36 PRJEB53466]
MIFLVNATYTVWLPVYSVNDHSYNNYFYKLLLFIELALSLVAFWFTIVTVYIITTSRAFHRNMNSLIAVIVASWLLSLVSRSILTPYVIGRWTIDGIASEFRCWWTDDVSEMAHINSMTDAWPLFFGGALTWYYMFTMVTCLFILSLERSFATYFIRNYEKTSRSYVFILLLIFQHVLVIIMTYIVFWNQIHFAPAITFCLVLNMAAVLIFWFNQRYNRFLIRKFDKNRKKSISLYSLPAKFQAKENVRSFNLTIRVIVCGFVLIFSAITCIIVLTCKLLPSLVTLTVYASENIVHLNPLIVCPVLIFSVSTWSKALMHSRLHWIHKITDITFIDLPQRNVDFLGAEDDLIGLSEDEDLKIIELLSIDPRVRTFPYSMLLALELFLAVATAYYVAKLAYVCVRIRKFHRNMNVLILLFALQWFEVVAANLMIKPYETGMMSVTEPGTTIKQWWTDDETEMIRLADVSDQFYLFVGGFLKWHYILSMCTVLFVLSIERAFACYFLNDYEQKSRNCLLVCLVFGYHGTIFVASVCFFYNAAHFAFGMLFVVTPNVVALLMFTYTRNFNQRILKAIEDFSNPADYSLPARFQVRENMRCFQMISRVLFSAFCLIFFGCSVNIIMFFELAPTLDPLWNLLFEFSIHLNPLLICPTLIYSVDAWRNFSVTGRFFQRLRLRTFNKVSSISFTDASGAVARTEKSRKETDAYFDQLNAAWT